PCSWSNDLRWWGRDRGRRSFFSAFRSRKLVLQILALQILVFQTQVPVGFSVSFTHTAALLRFVQKFVEKARDVRTLLHGVLIIQPRRSNHGQRPHHFAAYAGGSANEDEILQIRSRQRLVLPDDHAHRFLPRVEISAEQ